MESENATLAGICVSLQQTKIVYLIFLHLENPQNVAGIKPSIPESLPIEKLPH